MSAKSAGRDGGLVYSSRQGRMCPRCARPAAQCACPERRDSAAPESLRASVVVRVGRETRGRKGKGVTVVAGLPLSARALEELASRLKRQCGSGGTVKDRVIEIQGDHRDLLVAELSKEGWTVKRSGG